MKAIALPHNLPTAAAESKGISLRRNQKKWTTALLFAATAGVLLGVFGAFINVLSLVGFLPGDSLVGHVGVWLFVAVFPLGALTAHCLDKLEAAKKAIRIERCRRTGMTGADCE